MELTIQQINRKGILIEGLKDKMKMAVENYLEIGKDLVELKKLCDHGEFKILCDHELKIDYSTVKNMMQVYNRWKDDPEKVLGLPVKLVIAMSRNNTSDDVLERVFDNVSKGVIPKSRDVDKWKQVKELGKQMPNIDEEIIDAEFAELPYINEPEQESENTENRSETIEKIFKQLADIYNIYISSILDNITSIYTSSHFSQDEKKVIKDYHRKFQGFMEKLKYIYDPPRINKQEKEYKLSTEDAIEVTEALCESISERAPSATLPSIESERYKDWLLWMKKTGDKYSKGKEELLEIIAWIRNDTGNNKFPGWGAVIQSTKTFYEKFSSIETQFRFNQGKKEGSVEINVSEPIDDEYDGGV